MFFLVNFQVQFPNFGGYFVKSTSRGVLQERKLSWICDCLMLGKSKTCPLNWWFDGDLPWYKIKDQLKEIQVIYYIIMSASRGVCKSSLKRVKPKLIKRLPACVQQIKAKQDLRSTMLCP